MFYRISSIPKYESDSKVQFVIDAVYAFAHALDALKKDICPRYKGVCDAMTWYDGGEFYKKYLLKVDFNGKKTYMYLCMGWEYYVFIGRNDHSLWNVLHFQEYHQFIESVWISVHCHFSINIFHLKKECHFFITPKDFGTI